MSNIDTLRPYIKAEMVQDGDKITFVDAGKVTEKTFTEEQGPRKVLEIGVTFKGESKTYSPNGASQKNLKAAWGPDTENWIGKTAVLYVVPTNLGKDSILAKPAKEKEPGVPI